MASTFALALPLADTPPDDDGDPASTLVSVDALVPDIDEDASITDSDDEWALPEGLVIKQRCRAQRCVQTLVEERILFVGDDPPRWKMAPTHHARQSIHFEWASEEYVSVVVAQAEYSGGAHANQVLSCRTFQRKTGRRLTLGDVLGPKNAKRILRNVESVYAARGSGESVLGLDMANSNLRFFSGSDTEFLLKRGPSHVPTLILCRGNPTVQSMRGVVHMVDPTKIPLLHLLR